MFCQDFLQVSKFMNSLTIHANDYIINFNIRT